MSGFRTFEKKNLEILKIPKSNYKLVYSKVELEKEIKDIIDKKDFIKKNKIFLSKADNKTIKLFLN